MTFKKGNIPWNKDKDCREFNKDKIGKPTWNKGLTKKTDERVRINSNMISKSMKGNVIPLKVKIKISKKLKGRKKSKITIEKLRESQLGKKIPSITGDKNPSKRPEVKRKIREGVIRYIKNNSGDIRPNLGRNEKKILDELERKIGYNLVRQYYIKNLGYFVDGYCKETNTVYEVDEKPKIKERDIRREKEIINKLKCFFVRIIDYYKFPMAEVVQIPLAS